MPKRAARTAWGPMVQVALEQFNPPSQRIVTDDVALRLLPGGLRLLVGLFHPAWLRDGFFDLVDRRVPGVRGGLLCRKRAIDEALGEALAGGIRTVVILGAGMDSRACRFTANFYEVDLPENVAAKRAAVARVMGSLPANLHCVPLDFDAQDLAAALIAAGYAPQQKAFFIWEGVTQYITEAAVHASLSFLQQAARGSRLAMTYIRRDFIEGQELYGLEMLHRQVRARGELWQFGPDPQQVAPLLERYGWKEMFQMGSGEYQDRYVRPTGRVLPVMPVERLVLAERE